MKNLKTAKPISSGFSIIEFSQYKNVECQYTRQFIKNSRCVKIRESENEVTVKKQAGHNKAPCPGA